MVLRPLDSKNWEKISQIVFQIVVRMKVVVNNAVGVEFHKHALTSDMEDSNRRDRNQNGREIRMERIIA